MEFHSKTDLHVLLPVEMIILWQIFLAHLRQPRYPFIVEHISIKLCLIMFKLRQKGECKIDQTSQNRSGHLSRDTGGKKEVPLLLSGHSVGNSTHRIDPNILLVDHVFLFPAFMFVLCVSRCLFPDK